MVYVGLMYSHVDAFARWMLIHLLFNFRFNPKTNFEHKINQIAQFFNEIFYRRHIQRSGHPSNLIPGTSQMRHFPEFAFNRYASSIRLGSSRQLLSAMTQ